MAQLSIKRATVAKEPELKEFGSGRNQSVLLKVLLIENHGYYDKDNEWVDQGKTFHNAEIWGDLAYDADDELRVGDSLNLEAYINDEDEIEFCAQQITEEYEGRDGKEYSNTKLKIFDYVYIPKKEDTKPKKSNRRRDNDEDDYQEEKKSSRSNRGRRNKNDESSERRSSGRSRGRRA